MDTHAASENLQLIRTLMERVALYRRALAPVMIATGVIGAAGAGVGIAARIENLHAFVQLWLATGIAGIGVTLLIARRQSLQAREPFWSHPARRVVAALFPALLAGGCFGLGVLRLKNGEAQQGILLPVIWIALYGIALHAAGHFTTRGLRLFAWVFILSGCFAMPVLIDPPLHWPWQTPHIVMGVWFGVFHLLFGAWLYFTERKDSAA